MGSYTFLIAWRVACHGGSADNDPVGSARGWRYILRRPRLYNYPGISITFENSTKCYLKRRGQYRHGTNLSVDHDFPDPIPPNSITQFYLSNNNDYFDFGGWLAYYILETGEYEQPDANTLTLQLNFDHSGDGQHNTCSHSFGPQNDPPYNLPDPEGSSIQGDISAISWRLS